METKIENMHDQNQTEATVRDFLSKEFLLESLEVMEMFINSVLENDDEQSNVLTDDQFDKLDEIHAQLFNFVNDYKK